MADKNGNTQNRLRSEKSPYLLQHADNPVEWYPWGEEAFAAARRENKPIFLSIGYSTCHWCHVMAHESFENSDVARLMNETFISIKVDREERPDIDIVYMSVCQMMTGGGGWPLTILMTPEKEPFFAGTYIPRESHFGQMGLLEFIPHISELWANQKESIMSSANQIKQMVQDTSIKHSGGELSEDVLHLAFQQLFSKFDEIYGGFGDSPKFPTTHNLSFLLRYWKRTGNEKALELVESTLQAMRRGGIYDQIGFGFHRYSTVRDWVVPHFEKMLYDQAMISIAYLEAFQATGKPEYATTAREIFNYVMGSMKASGGGFYSAEDADSEGEEGKFYLWTTEELRKVLSPQEADLAAKVFNMNIGGNFVDQSKCNRTTDNILYMTKNFDEIAVDLHLSREDLSQSMNTIRGKLYTHRENRVHPFKDDKILADWNGLIIAALAMGGRILGNESYIDSAMEAAEFILHKMCLQDGRLLHRYRNGEAALPAHVDDYAFLIFGLLELYETTFDSKYLEKALYLNQVLLKHYWDDVNGGFYFTACNSEKLLIRKKEIYDGAIPSGNSISMFNLLRLGRLTANSDFEKKAIEIGKAFYEDVSQQPGAYTQLMVALDFLMGPSFEIVIAGKPDADDTKKMLEMVQKPFIPNKVVVFRPAGEKSPEIDTLLPVISYTASPEGRAMAYVCRNYNCRLPTSDPGKIPELLGSRLPT
jgi:uncharacterized protein